MSGLYDVSVCMGGNCCLSVVVMGFVLKNGGFLQFFDILMAVGWGKVGRFGCFLRFAAILGVLWQQLRLCDSAWVLGAFGALICRNFVCFCIYVRVNVFACGKMNFLSLCFV